MVAISWIIRIILILVSLGLIVVVLLQKSKQAGMGALAGGDSFSLKGKAKGSEALLEKLTKIGTAAFMILAVLLMVITKYFL